MIKIGVLTVFLLIVVQDVAPAQTTVVDTLVLEPLPLDSTYLRREGREVFIGWYPQDDSLSAGIGSKHFTNWFKDNPEVAVVDVFGVYPGDVDRTIKISKERISRDTVGYEPSIRMVAEVVDLKDTYRQVFDIGSSEYNVGDTITLDLLGQETGEILDTGVKLVFNDGIVDTAAYFEVDLQDFEGFHIWRGLSPYPTEMAIIADLSKEDAFRGVDVDSVYFEEWPQTDSQGKKYYEYVDDNAFVGFTYYYQVSTYDRGYFKGQFLFNKLDSWICDEECTQDTLSNPDLPHCDLAVDCEDTALEITVSVDTNEDLQRIYTVPNPYRTGTSAQTAPNYHNFPDNSIKFFNVPNEAELKIFTIAGDLVWETYHTSPDGSNGVITWNTMNKHGEMTCSGVYIFKCESGTGDHVYGRIVIIR
jgi:hypothetical protein